MNSTPDRSVCGTCARTFGSGETFCPFDRTPLQPLPRIPTDPLIGTVVAGAYTVLSRLGGGGMGVVYRARQNRLQRDVALKILSQQLSADDRARERFRTEALAVSQLSNGHTVAIHDFGSTEDGLLYIVMQLVEGESLSARVARSSCDLRAAVSIAAQVCESLAEAHERQPQVVHRDIKPDNLMVRRDASGEDFVTVLDFGLARLAGSDRLTASGLVIGTPVYMAPEQAQTDSVDGRTDLYSLGVVLYELLSGRVPFMSPDPTALLYKHVWEEPPYVGSGSRVVIPDSLAALVHLLLAKKPADRPASARIVRARLLEILRELPPNPADGAGVKISSFDTLPAIVTRSPVPRLVSPPPASLTEALGAAARQAQSAPRDSGSSFLSEVVSAISSEQPPVAGALPTSGPAVAPVATSPASEGTRFTGRPTRPVFQAAPQVDFLAEDHPENVAPARTGSRRTFVLLALVGALVLLAAGGWVAHRSGTPPAPVVEAQPPPPPPAPLAVPVPTAVAALPSPAALPAAPAPVATPEPVAHPSESLPAADDEPAAADSDRRRSGPRRRRNDGTGGDFPTVPE